MFPGRNNRVIQISTILRYAQLHGGWEYISWNVRYWRDEILRVQRAAYDASLEEGGDPIVWSERLRVDAWEPGRRTLIDRNDFVEQVVREPY